MSHFGLWAGAEEAARAGHHPSPPALPKPEGTNAECVCGLQGTSTDKAEKRLQLLMAWKRQEVEAEVWLKYHASRAGQKMEQGQVWHELLSPQEKHISPFWEGSRAGFLAQAWQQCHGQLPRQGLVSAHALHIALQEQLSLMPQAEVCSWL